jgi:hypothetical protein
LLILERYDRIFEKIRTVGDASTRDIANRLLEWLTYSKRPLKLYELLNGLGFDPATTVVQGPKLVSARAVELCKPVVEISKGGSVDFVHFSAKE